MPEHLDPDLRPGEHPEAGQQATARPPAELRSTLPQGLRSRTDGDAGAVEADLLVREQPRRSSTGSRRPHRSPPGTRPRPPPLSVPARAALRSGQSCAGSIARGHPAIRAGPGGSGPGTRTSIRLRRAANSSSSRTAQRRPPRRASPGASRTSQGRRPCARRRRAARALTAPRPAARAAGRSPGSIWAIAAGARGVLEPSDDIAEDRGSERPNPLSRSTAGSASASRRPQHGTQRERLARRARRPQVIAVDLDDAPPRRIHVDLRDGHEDRRAGSHGARQELELRRRTVRPMRR